AARGVVVVIDVLRAFTVSAYALARGARELLLVRGVEEALTLRDETHPDALLAGEVGGRLIPGFDLNNSPARMQSADVRDRLIIQRTGAGTQGAVNARHASCRIRGGGPDYADANRRTFRGWRQADHRRRGLRRLPGGAAHRARGRR